MIYHVGSVLYNSFLRLQSPPVSPSQMGSEFLQLPRSWQDMMMARLRTPGGQAVWEQGQRLKAGHCDSLISLEGGGGMCTARCMVTNCSYCGAEAFKPVSKDPFIRSMIARSHKQRVYLCSRCESVRYCSLQCQSDDWETHRLDCKRFKVVSQ